MIWDDLNSKGVRDAFNHIAATLKRMRSGTVISLEFYRGWVGKRARLHPIGIVRG